MGHDAKTGSLTMLVTDLLFRDDDKWRAIVEEYAQDNDLFLEDFRKAWIKLVNGDRLVMFVSLQKIPIQTAQLFFLKVITLYASKMHMETSQSPTATRMLTLKILEEEGTEEIIEL